MSVDVEDWFCVHNLNPLIPYEEWDRCDSRVERSTLRLLEIFRRRKTEATFFVLGWVADRFPDLVREIAHQGHEVGTHGYAHRLLTFMRPEEFRDDLLRSLDALARATTQAVRGFRAPSFSLTPRTLWAIDILRASGMRYDSSVFPTAMHPDYGMPHAPLHPYELTDGLLELPLGVAEIVRQRVPCGGGGYFRIYPYALTRRLMRSCNAAGRPVMFYVHPWELDPGHPRVAGLPWSKRFRHYTNLDKTEERLERVLEDFSFTSARRLIPEQPRSRG